MEHHANLVPWQQALPASGGRSCATWRSTSTASCPSTRSTPSSPAGDVRMVAFAHVSNVLGTINPVAEITARARAAGAVTLIDGAQAVPQMPVDVERAGADFYAWTGHKALGPTGIGVLHGRRELLESMEPFLTGGDMIASVGLQETTWNELPFKFEAGTPPIAEAVGLAAAVDYLAALGMDRVREHERALTELMLARLAEVPGLRVVGPPAGRERGALASFTVEGMHPHDVAELLGREGVCVRAGHHCAQPLMRCLGVARRPGRASASTTTSPTSTRWSRRCRAADEVFGLCDGRPVPRLHPRALQAPEELRRARPARPRGARAQPAVRRRARRAHPRRGRSHRGPALPRPRLRDLPGGRLDRLRGAEGDAAGGGRRSSTPTG